MRCENPWSASVGATKKTSASAVVTSANEAAASAGSEIRAIWPHCALDGLLGDDVLERRPADEREEGVVEREEAEIAPRAADDGRADAADHDRDGERQEEERQE